MSILRRFFGKKDDNEGDSAPSDDIDSGPLVANAYIKDPLSLQVLFAEVWQVNAEAIQAALRNYHPSMRGARCELEPDLAVEGKIIGLIGWGQHVIRIVGFDLPMPADAVETCVAPAHYSQEMKARARAHRSHVLLFYVGDELSVLERYVALAAVAGAFGSCGALVVLNEIAHASFPAAALVRQDLAMDMLEALRTLPIPALYVGFVKCEVEDVTGVWMRTFGAPRLMLPDFAAHAAGHHEGERYFELFDNVLRYLLTSGDWMEAGHTMQVGDNEFLRLREPGSQEGFLQDEGGLFVVEIIGRDQVRR